jgi:FAD binding domain
LDLEGQLSVNLESLAEPSAGYGLIRTRSAVELTAGMRAFFVVGADGYWSAVRQALDVEYRELGGAQTYGVFELEADWPDDEVRVVLTEGTANVLWPLGGGRYRWSFELIEAGLPPPRLKRRLLMQAGDEAFPYLAKEDLEGLIAERAPWFGAAIGELASGLLLKALQNGYRGQFVRAQDLFDDMYASLADRSSRKLAHPVMVPPKPAGKWEELSTS